MGYETIHETVVSDITDIIKNGVNLAKDTVSKPRGSGVGYAGSLTRATKGLVMEFPVLVSKANHIESAGIVAKAYEAKFVTLLQLAFAACNITNAKDGIDYIKDFHTNLDKKMSVDDFIDMMDGYVKTHESAISADSYAMYRAVTEDMKNLTYYFGEDVNESSLNSYHVMNHYGKLVVKEDYADNGNIYPGEPPEGFRPRKYLSRDEIEKQLQGARNKHADDERRNAANRTAKANEPSEQEIDKMDTDIAKNRQFLITNNIVSGDLKKVNELTPTMMVVNFIYKESEGAQAVSQQLVVGVKAKLYEVEPMDVINKLLTKHVDSNVLLKLVQVSTRQISFVKDFLLALDDAKLDAVSKRGSTNKLFKVLERRAIGGKIRRTLKFKDYNKAISSLVISQEEAEELLKNNIDVSNPGVIRPIMEKLNLISFAIIDESSESVNFIFDTGDDVYETIPFSKLEREQKDGMSKKVINLMAKINR